MSIANIAFSRIFIHVSHSLYICRRNLQAAMDKEDCGLIAVNPQLNQVWVTYI
jgi:hypothetical protein